MEILPIPDEYKKGIPLIPRSSLAPAYDNKGFHGFPERHGIDTGILLSGDLDRLTSVAAPWLLSLIQEWIFFGLLDEFQKRLQVRLDPDEFLNLTEDGIVCLTSVPLLPYIRRVYEHKAASILASESSTTDLILSLQSCKRLNFSELQDIVNRDEAPRKNSQRDQATKSNSDFTSAVAISSECLRVIGMTNTFLLPQVGMSLEIFARSLARAAFLVTGDLVVGSDTGPSFDDHFALLMKKNGRCLAKADRVRNTTTHIEFVLTLLPSHDVGDHSNCTRENCHALLTLERMKTLHRPASCTCNLVPFDSETLGSVLKAGGNPGIVRNVNGAGSASFEIVDVWKKKYVAISHVWSHGLCNSDANALPECQLNRLFDLIYKLNPGEKYALWLDPISVPLRPTYKSLAISKMKDVYDKADKVLVLDRSLEQVGVNWIERVLELICSDWLSRLWTFQEGRLANSLLIQFKDGAVPIEDLLTQWSGNISTEEDMFHPFHSQIILLLKTHISARLYSSQIIPTDVSAAENFMDLLSALRHRATTVASDEPVVLWALLGLPHKDNPSMTDIYKSSKEVPDDIIFMHAPRLQIPGLRWAPSTFLFKGNPYTPGSGRSGFVTSKGFGLQKDGILFGKQIVSMNDIGDSISVMRQLCVVNNGTAEPHCVFVSEDFEPRSMRVLTDAAIILQESIASSSRLRSHGVLVSGVRIEHEPEKDILIAYCHYEMQVLVIKWREYIARWTKMCAEAGLVIELSSTLCHQQVWCVD